MESKILPDDHLNCIELLLNKVAENSPINKNEATVLHLGAHKGEEVDSYIKSGYSEIILCEANPSLSSNLEKKFSENPSISTINAAISDQDGQINFHVHKTKKGSLESASILPLKELGEIVPVFDSSEIISVPSKTLDTLAEEMNLSDQVQLLTIDIQGAEKLAILGGENFIPTVKAIICEVNLIQNYEGCALEYEIDKLFEQYGFEKIFCIYHELYTDKKRFPAWGECLWINRN